MKKWLKKLKFNIILHLLSFGEAKRIQNNLNTRLPSAGLALGLIKVKEIINRKKK